jgi:hypothetical protein
MPFVVVLEPKTDSWALRVEAPMSCIAAAMVRFSIWFAGSPHFLAESWAMQITRGGGAGYPTDEVDRVGNTLDQILGLQGYVHNRFLSLP